MLEIKWCSYHENREIPQNLKIELLYDPVSLFLQEPNDLKSVQKEISVLLFITAYLQKSRYENNPSIWVNT